MYISDVLFLLTRKCKCTAQLSEKHIQVSFSPRGGCVLNGKSNKGKERKGQDTADPRYGRGES